MLLPMPISIITILQQYGYDAISNNQREITNLPSILENAMIKLATTLRSHLFLIPALGTE